MTNPERPHLHGTTRQVAAAVLSLAVFSGAVADYKNPITLGFAGLAQMGLLRIIEGSRKEVESSLFIATDRNR